MNRSPSATAFIRFRAFEIDSDNQLLRKAGLPIKLAPQPFKVLTLLSSRPRQLVTREELQKEIWADGTVVDFEHGLNFCIREIRRVLGDDPDAPQFIETVPRRGYRFVAPVEMMVEAQPPLSIQDGSPEAPRRTEAVAPKSKHFRGLLALGVSVLCLTAFSATLLELNIGGLRSRLFGMTRAPIRSIAILQLRNLSGNPDQDYFADGLTDELTTNVARIASLKVISATTTRQYRDSRDLLPQIARELKVDAVVEGSVVRSGQRVRITAQLIDARTDTHLWAQSYECDFGEILEIQDSIALEIAAQVRANLTPAERESFDVQRTVVPEAYDAYLRGRNELGKQRQEALLRGLEYFQKAIALDRLYPSAYAGLSDSYTLLANYGGLPTREASPLAKSAALKALELDHTLAYAHGALAYVKFHFDWDWAGAEAEFRRALELDPSDPTTHLHYAEFLSCLARHHEAIREVRLAQEFAPRSLVIRANIGRLLFYARRYDEAISELQGLLVENPNLVFARIHLAKCYEQKRMYPEALAEFQKVKVLFNGQEGVGSAHLYASLKRVREAQRLLQYLEQPPPDGIQDWFFIAEVHAQLGDKDQAFHWLSLAFENRDYFLTFLKVDPGMDPLRSDPRFNVFLKQIGLT
ncbi:MAG TPA: winged helix-turn-helix domain-containing protein [Terriglobia bacterium]|nr:winged helix-turn-helix domain-containing protein [Terriglobia bacterium]